MQKKNFNKLAQIEEEVRFSALSLYKLCKLLHRSNFRNAVISTKKRSSGYDSVFLIRPDSLFRVQLEIRKLYSTADTGQVKRFEAVLDSLDVKALVEANVFKSARSESRAAAQGPWAEQLPGKERRSQIGIGEPQSFS